MFYQTRPLALGRRSLNDQSPCSGWRFLVPQVSWAPSLSSQPWDMRHYTQSSPLGQDRVALRAKAFADRRGGKAEGLSTLAWIDQSKELVHLPFDDAMKLVVCEWGRNPAAAGSNLIAWVVKATAHPSKAPEQLRPFEESVDLRVRHLNNRHRNKTFQFRQHSWRSCARKTLFPATFSRFSPVGIAFAKGECR